MTLDSEEHSTPSLKRRWQQNPEHWRDRLSGLDSLPQLTILGLLTGILAAVAGTTINQLAFGSGTIFHPPQATLQSLFELPFMAMSGLIVAAFAALFIRLQAACCKASLNRPIALRFAMAGLLAGCVSIFAPQIMGLGYDTIDNALAGNMSFWLLLGILAAKLLVTGVSLGVGIAGGVIGPLLFMGACLTTRWAFGCEGLFQTLLKVQGKNSHFVAAEQLLSRTGARSLLDRHIKSSPAEITYAEAEQLLIHHPHCIIG